MDSPNVLLLDEPTNDFDVETLTALEDLLDSFAGTLLVISHDRYFLERVCDTFIGLTGDKSLRDLPRGIDEYLQLRKDNQVSKPKAGEKKAATILEQKAAKKELARIEKQLERRAARISELEKELITTDNDYEKLAALTGELDSLKIEHSKLEEEWLQANIS
jgi:ATP-binding cassette subfamily F protein uup